MSGTVPILSIICMSIACLISIALPIGLLLFFRSFKKADIYPFFVGCGIMFFFAFVFEAAAHRAILSSTAGGFIQSHFWMYALYGGLMAGLFEETGRFLAFRLTLRKYLGKNQNALMYGAGHGGFESIYLVTMTMITNLVWSYMINTGNTARLAGNLSGDALEQVQAGIEALVTTPSYLFLLGGIERVIAIVLHIALSVLVWFAVKEKDKLYLYPLAIFLHFAVDTIGVALSALGVNTILIEVALAFFTCVTVLIARRVWRGAQ